MNDRIQLRKEGGLRWLIVNQPEKRNALSVDMRAHAQEVLEEIAADDAARVLIIAGAGDTFVSGADISEFEARRSTPEAAAAHQAASMVLFETLQRLQKPTIAMIHGFCFGGGLALAASCDLRLCADNALFSIPSARLGIGYPIAFTRLLVDLVGPSTTKEILITARRYSAAEALSLGLVNRVLPKAELEDYVRSYAQGIASNAPLSVRAAKIIVDECRKAGAAHDLARCEAAVQTCALSEDFKTGRRAFMAKQEPVFTGR